MQQYAADGNPAQTFDRSCLFKITRRAATDSYIIRSMLNNRLTFYFSGNEVLTKEIPPNDADVSVNDTFKLEYNPIRECFVIKPYSSSNVVAANNTTASGMAGAPNSYLIKSTESASGNQSRWYMYQYTGETKSGVIPVFSPSTANNAIIQQWQFNGKDQSKWLFEVQSGGYFRIKSLYSNKYIGVDSTATTVIRQYDTSSDYTLWRFVETASGNYKLICKAIESSGNVLAVPLNANSNGTNLTIVPYTDDANYRDEWIIQYTSILLAIDDTDNASRHTYFTDTQTNLETKRNGCASIVTTVRYSAATVTEMINYLQSNDVFIVHTHGKQTGFKISNTGTKFIHLNDLNGQDLSNISFALLMTCNTGDNYNVTNITNNTPVNIVEQMVICGAETVVGFNDITYVSDCNDFASDLTDKLVNEGLSIKEAIYDIDYVSYIKNMSNIAVIAGNEHNKLW